MTSLYAKVLSQMRFEKEHGIKKRTIRIDLPKEQWSTCEACEGSGLKYMERNLHESAGWVPCGCHKGMKTFEYKTVYRVPAKSSS